MANNQYPWEEFEPDKETVVNGDKQVEKVNQQISSQISYFRILVRVSKEFQTYEAETSVGFFGSLKDNEERLTKASQELQAFAYERLNEMIAYKNIANATSMPKSNKKSWEELLATDNAKFATGKEVKSADFKNIPQAIYDLAKKGLQGRLIWTLRSDEIIAIAKDEWNKL